MKEYPKVYKYGSGDTYKGDMKIGDGNFGHASKVRYIDPMPCRDMNKVKTIKSSYSNTPKEAFKYEN